LKPTPDARLSCNKSPPRGAINGLMDEIIEVREHVAHPGLDDAASSRGTDEVNAVIRRYAK